jgi:hypothetical protein
MEDMAVLTAILARIATLTPIIIAWAIGIVLALARWKRHPRVSLFALVAFVVMIVTTIITSVLYIWLPMTIRNSGWSVAQISTILAGVGIVSTVIQAVAWAMVLWAIFGWRDQRKEENLFPPAPPAFGNAPREQSATPGFTQR